MTTKIPFQLMEDATAGSIFFWDATGAPAELVVGTNGHVLTLVAGIPTWQAAAGGGLTDIVDDTSPQLGDNLDMNGFDLISLANADIDIIPNGTGNVNLGTMTFDADQTIGAGQDNYVLTYDDGTGLISLEVSASGGATVINDLTDVDTATTAPTDGQVLTWNNTNSEWEPQDATGGSGGGGGFTVETPLSTTSGTTKDFTVASGTKQIIVHFDAVSLSGTDNILVQLGDAGGFEATGYRSEAARIDGAPNGATSTAGFIIRVQDAAAQEQSGSIILTLMDEANNTWTAEGIVGYDGNAIPIVTSGIKSLSAELTQVRITPTGANTFDNGQVGLSYHGGSGGEASGFDTGLLHIQDQKADSTNGGSSSSGLQTRDLNTEVTNEITGASLAANQITLPAGTYYMEAECPCYQTDSTQAILRDTTGAANLLIGNSSHYSGGTTQAGGIAKVSGRFTLSVQSVLELQQYIQSAQASNGLGVAAANATGEIYSDIKIWEVKTGAGGGSGGAMVELGSYTISNDTSVDIGSGLDLSAAIDGTYSSYEIHFTGLVPATDSTAFWIRTSTDGGSTFDAGGTDYEWSHNRQSSGTTTPVIRSGNGDSKISIENASTNWGNAAVESFSGRLVISNPSDASVYCNIRYEAEGIASDGNILSVQGSGSRYAAADVDAIRLLMASGNITSGTVKLYGIS